MSNPRIPRPRINFRHTHTTFDHTNFFLTCRLAYPRLDVSYDQTTQDPSAQASGTNFMDTCMRDHSMLFFLLQSFRFVCMHVRTCEYVCVHTAHMKSDTTRNYSSCKLKKMSNFTNVLMNSCIYTYMHIHPHILKAFFCTQQSAGML